MVGAAVIVTRAITCSPPGPGFYPQLVSLFALIFSIGILVDDAIVVVENIHRHMTSANCPEQAIPAAVDEVGGPTILATFTVIAALLPMAFVSGLMGPYMLPIPINASSGMLISLAVAFIFTPWLYRAGCLPQVTATNQAPAIHQPTSPSGLAAFFSAFCPHHDALLRQTAGKKPFMAAGEHARSHLRVSRPGRGKGGSAENAALRQQSEFQVMLDMPEGTALETTQQVLQAMADQLATIPETTDYQLYAGTSAPINFNGLVRQYYLRQEPHQGDIQVNLVDKHQRSRKATT